jgi:hypothetical protein
MLTWSCRTFFTSNPCQFVLALLMTILVGKSLALMYKSPFASTATLSVPIEAKPSGRQDRKFKLSLMIILSLDVSFPKLSPVELYGVHLHLTYYVWSLRWNEKYKQSQAVGCSAKEWLRSSEFQWLVCLLYTLISSAHMTIPRDLRTPTAGDYSRAVDASNSAETITRVLYPNDNHDGKYHYSYSFSPRPTTYRLPCIYAEKSARNSGWNNSISGPPLV